MEINELRKIKGYTQKEVSDIFQIPLRTYKRYENNKSLIGTFKYREIYKLILDLPVKKKKIDINHYKITVVGTGYVGLSLAVLLAKNNDVIALDIDKKKIDSINNRKAYIKDSLLINILEKEKLNLKAEIVNDEAFKNRDFIIISTNTDFNPTTNNFDMSSVISSIERIRKVNKKVLVVIKSTVPLGFTKSLNDENIIFSPEFLREGQSIYDNLHPSRIIIGSDYPNNKIRKFVTSLINIALDNVETLYMSSQEAEAVKLFSNAYLAMRVAYFNELDTYAEMNDLSSLKIIKGVCKDKRIGDYYNNPSFGYGGYCLPKDTAQLKNSFLNISNNNIIEAIVKSNRTRKEYIVDQIVSKVNKMKKDKEKVIVGIYRLSMKKDSDNFRSSSTLDLVALLKNRGINIIIYEPGYINKDSEENLNLFINKSDIIIANRLDEKINPYINKVYTRDLINID